MVDENMELELLQQISESNPKYVVMMTNDKGQIIKSVPKIYEYIMGHFKEDTSIGRFKILRNDVLIYSQ
jgi:hypothetical protein